MKKCNNFTIKTWYKCMDVLFDDIPARYFFKYIDTLQFCTDELSVYLFTFNIYMKIFIDRCYFGKIKRAVFSVTNKEYNVVIAVGLVRIRDEHKFIVYSQFFIISSVENLFFCIKENLQKKKKFFIYTNTNKKFNLIEKTKLLSQLNHLNCNFLQTNLISILNNKKKIKCAKKKFKFLLLFEYNYNHEFYLLLHRYIHKIKLLLEKKSIVLITNDPLDILKKKMLNIIEDKKSK